MIFKEEDTLKTEQAASVNLNEDVSHNTGTNNYKELMGLTYNNNQTNLIPSRFKWGRSLIKVID